MSILIRGHQMVHCMKETVYFSCLTTSHINISICFWYWNHFEMGCRMVWWVWTDQWSSLCFVHTYWQTHLVQNVILHSTLPSSTGTPKWCSYILKSFHFCFLLILECIASVRCLCIALKSFFNSDFVLDRDSIKSKCPSAVKACGEDFTRSIGCVLIPQLLPSNIFCFCYLFFFWDTKLLNVKMFDLCVFGQF